MNTRRIADIIIGIRHRRGLGDIDSLARSIAEVGLLHPVVIRSDGAYRWRATTRSVRGAGVERGAGSDNGAAE
jgi:hypothetical protein